MRMARRGWMMRTKDAAVDIKKKTKWSGVTWLANWTFGFKKYIETILANPNYSAPVKPTGKQQKNHNKNDLRRIQSMVRTCWKIRGGCCCWRNQWPNSSSCCAWQSIYCRAWGPTYMHSLGCPSFLSYRNIMIGPPSCCCWLH